MDSDTQDPSYLCALAFHLDTLYPARRKVRKPTLRSGDSKRAAAVLDSLARLLVSKDKGQSVAVGAGLDDTGHVELYVSENTAVFPLTVAHLRDICTRLIDIRATIQASPDPAAILREVSTPAHLLVEPAEGTVFASLRALQLSLYRHSIRRIHAQFTKDRWPDRLRFTLACIQGPPANTRDDLSEDEREVLEKLQDSETVRGHVDGIGGAVQRVQDSISQGSDYDLNNVHLACAELAFVIGARELDNYMFFFNRFILAYLNRIGDPPKKCLDMAKWLKKVSFVITEYRNLVTILTKPALSTMFGDHVAIHSIDNEPPRKALVTKLEVDDILSTFDDLGFNSGNFEDIYGLAGEIAAAAGYPQAALVHCECALLRHFDQLGRTTLPYIGVSKVSCVYCDRYFACYREDRGSELRTLGTHGKPAAWRWPDLPDDGLMRATFCEKLRSDIKDMLSVANMDRRILNDLLSTSSYVGFKQTTVYWRPAEIVVASLDDK